MGQNLAVRIKVLFLGSTLRQDIGWHDEAENATGKLMSRLSSDTMSIRGKLLDVSCLKLLKQRLKVKIRCS
jgi:hypothetical protein